MRSPVVALFIGIVLGAAVGAVGYAVYDRMGDDGSSATTNGSGTESPTPQRDQVTALGRLEPASGIVAVGAPPGYRLGSLAVKVGDSVEPGAEIGRLDGYGAQVEEVEYVNIQLEEAQKRCAADEAYGQALVDEAEAAEALLASQALEIQAAETRLKSLELKSQLAADELARLEGLEDRLVSQAERQRQRLAAAQAANELEAAHQSLAQLQAAYDANAEAAKRKRASAEANLARIRTSDPRRGLQQQLKLAQSKLEAMLVRAPMDGVILRVRTRPGELTGQRPVVELGDTRRMYVVAEVDESEVALVQQGQQADVTDGGLGVSRLTGEVEQVGSVVAGNVETALDPRATVDRRVVEVRIRLRAKDCPLAARYVGMQVDVTIKVKPEAEAEER